MIHACIPVTSNFFSDKGYPCFFGNTHTAQTKYRLNGMFSFSVNTDAGKYYEAYGKFQIATNLGNSITVWDVPREKAKDIPLREEFHKQFEFCFTAPSSFKDTGRFTLYGSVHESDAITGDDLVGKYNDEKIEAKSVFQTERTMKFKGDGEYYVRISKMRLDLA